MKSFLFLICLSMSFLVHGAVNKNSVKVFSSKATNALDAKFGINEKLGRAWVNVVIDEDPGDREVDTYKVKVKVDGLDYDSKEGVITFTNGTKSTICAHVKEGKIQETGKCKFENKVEKSKADNGFKIEKKKESALNLIINA